MGVATTQPTSAGPELHDYGHELPREAGNVAMSDLPTPSLLLANFPSGIQTMFPSQVLLRPSVIRERAVYRE